MVGGFHISEDVFVTIVNGNGVLEVAGFVQGGRLLAVNLIWLHNENVIFVFESC